LTAPVQRAPLRLGSVATLSRNFQLGWLSPLLRDEQVQIRLVAGLPLIVPSPNSAVRPAFDLLLEEAGAHPVLRGMLGLA